MVNNLLFCTTTKISVFYRLWISQANFEGEPTPATVKCMSRWWVLFGIRDVGYVFS